MEKPMKHGTPRTIISFAVLTLAVFLVGCENQVLLSPKGQVGLEERDLIYFATGMMLIVILPVIFMTLYFAWKYRSTNEEAEYEPDWHHSNKIEATVWLIPVAIIIALGTVTWIATHKLDPYRPIDSDVPPINVEVVSLDWKWLFIYPDYGIATVNEMAMPVGVPVNFKLTSSNMMNSFFIPVLGSQVYTMPSMQTKLHLIADQTGEFDGISANYSGQGFAQMRFKALSLDRQDFDKWVAEVKASGQDLNRERYASLVQPSEKHPVQYFAYTDKSLFHGIVNRCWDGKSVCLDDQMHREKLVRDARADLRNSSPVDFSQWADDIICAIQPQRMSQLEN
ncbi:cytochrome bo3 quinol oxidase subunit 2 [Falsochrobactrum ovis]|uniref:Ubiquinol oxidase subunit 2 n=2 Tax=Falsochrobactrum ovis TaxID=1293442 RepID=A0A364JZ21_9HYPH|nr:cytochrome bo3 quinol oxidase subunit 2 [Falsochrobactrum ovis]